MKFHQLARHRIGGYGYLSAVLLLAVVSGCRKVSEPSPSSAEPVRPSAHSGDEPKPSRSEAAHLGPSLTHWRCPLETAPVSEAVGGSWERVPELDTDAMAVFRAPLREPVLGSPASSRVRLTPTGEPAERPLQLSSLEDLEAGGFAFQPAEERRVPFQVALTSAGSATCSVVLPSGTTTITVFARGKPALGVPPEMHLVWNGADLGVRHVGSPTVAPYPAEAVAVSGTNTLEIVFTNDYWQEGGEDRNLYLERIQFEQPAYVYQAAGRDGTDSAAPVPVVAAYLPQSATLEGYRSAEPVPGVTAFASQAGYYAIAGETRAAVPLPARGSAAFECRVPAAGVLEMAFAAVPAAWEGGSDGIYFLVSVESVPGSTPVLELFLDPTHYPSHRKWLPREIDVGAFAGREIQVVVETFPYYPLPLDAERAGTSAFDWALVSEPVVRSRATASERNVILISLDTLRADRLGCYGHDRDTSPELDAFSRECMLFENVMAQANWTLPAHISMLASLYTSAHGIASPRTALRDAVTVARVLQHEGYQTQAFVDGGFMGEQFGLFQGFDAYHSFEQDGFETILPAAREWLQAHSGGPFFLFLHTYDIHAPYDPPAEFQALFPPPAGSTPDLIRRIQRSFINEHDSLEENAADPVSPVELAQVESLYDAGIRYTDHLLGDFLSFLRESGLLDRCLVVVTSDHGEGMMEHGLLNHGNSYYEELVHVPLLVRVPGKAGGTRVPDLVELVDIPPTITEWALGEVPEDFQGRSVMLVPAGGKGAVRAAYAEGRASGEYAVAVREGELKFMRMGSRPPELYNLRYDPEERVNLAPREPRLVEGLTSRAEAFRAANEARSRAESRQEAGISEERMEELRKLGYF